MQQDGMGLCPNPVTIIFRIIAVGMTGLSLIKHYLSTLTKRPRTLTSLARQRSKDAIVKFGVLQIWNACPEPAFL